ncbi:MAG: outer membrane protein assembly factor BamE, partial [Silicimonas sp.]|nr:outer membrane protein assembly factor BamE [Silicimonas sp.]
EDSHGYIPDQALLSQVQLGVDTKDTTARLLGRPGTAGIIDDRGWYYVKSDYERFLWRAPVEVDRQVVAVSFSEAGVVENVERFGLEDGQVVALSRRVTTSNTRGIGFLRQLFSNIGGLDAGSFLDEG